MNIWIASHECSGIAEAGGVKNVTFSLCKELQACGNNTVLFMPEFGCTSYSHIKDLEKNIFEAEIRIAEKTELVSYSKAVSTDYGFTIIFVNHLCFSSKEAVYTYTENEEKLNPEHKKGWGHLDAKFIDTLFAKSVDAFGKYTRIEDLPHIIHCQDASTATIPLYTSNNPLLKSAKTIVTIHNAGPYYHHEYADTDEAVFYTGFPPLTFEKCLNKGKPEPFLIAAETGTLLTTVSPFYAEELTDPENNDITDGLAGIFAEKNIPITGITNGIDVDLYEPKYTSISRLPYDFSPEKGDLQGKYLSRMYFLEKLSKNDPEILVDIKKYGNLKEPDSETIFLVYQGRLASQKGLKVLSDTLPAILSRNENIRVIVTGQGESELEKSFTLLSENPDFSGRFVFLNGYNRKAARLTVASGDFIILPSFFEPCGLEDFIAELYGTLPVASRTGGLQKILDGKTGFLYSPNTAEKLEEKIQEAINMQISEKDRIYEMIKYGASYTRTEYAWDKVVKNEYIPLFEALVNK